MTDLKNINYNAKIGLVDIIKYQRFPLGFNDGWKATPFHKEYDDWFRNDQLTYERGRHFGILIRMAKVKLVDSTRNLTRDAVLIWNKAVAGRIIS